MTIGVERTVLSSSGGQMNAPFGCKFAIWY
jgi:hypothetical protein